jgi:hypothetical protein
MRCRSIIIPSLPHVYMSIWVLDCRENLVASLSRCHSAKNDRKNIKVEKCDWVDITLMVRVTSEDTLNADDIDTYSSHKYLLFIICVIFVRYYFKIVINI